MPHELENEMRDPPVDINEGLLDGIQGSMLGMALGEALGAHVESQSYKYLQANPVKDLGSGGTLGLEKGKVSAHLVCYQAIFWSESSSSKFIYRCIFPLNTDSMRRKEWDCSPSDNRLHMT